MSDGDPKRLLEAREATSEERDLLRSGLDAGPPPEARAAVWAALATRLPGIGGGGGPGAGGGGVGGGGAGAGAATGVSTGVKVAGALAFAALIAGGIGIVTTSARNPPTAVVPAAASLTSRASAPAAAVTSTSGAETTPAASSGREIQAPPEDSAGVVHVPPPHPRTMPSSGSSAPAIPRAVALREEAALLASARDALHGGDARRALTVLDEARAKHPAGALTQEREVVTIEALAQAGDKAGASRHAESFLRAFPGSPHSSHVRTFLAR